MADSGASSVPYGSVIHATREAIVAVDLQQRIVTFNPAAERLFGHGAAQVIGQPLSLLIPPAQRDAHVEHVRAFARSPLDERPMDDWLPIFGRHADGHDIALEATISRTELPGADGPRPLLVAMLREGGEVQRLRADLSLAEGRLDALVDLLPLPMWIGSDGRIVRANAPCAAFFGFDGADTMHGQPVAPRIAPASAAALHAATAAVVARPGTCEPVQVRLCRRDGTLRDVQLLVGALPGRGGPTLHQIAVDLTDIRREATGLRALAANLQQGREDERRRLARELHDVLGQQLTGLKVALAGLGPVLAPGEETDRRRAELDELVDGTVALVRGMARELRPPLLDALGLRGALESLGRDAARRMGIEVTTRLVGTPPQLPDATAVALYRIVQEALTNVARHARATDVDITLDLDRRDLVLAVHDNGVGFPPELTQNGGSLGLLGMRERAQAVGARIEFDNPPGGGARVTVRRALADAAGVQA